MFTLLCLIKFYLNLHFKKLSKFCLILHECNLYMKFILLLLFLEGSIRKYIFASPLLIPIKYFLLFFVIFKNKPNYFLFSTLLLITFLPFVSYYFNSNKIVGLPIAIYDLFSYTIYPYLLFGLSSFSFTKFILKKGEKHIRSIINLIFNFSLFQVF